MSRGLIRSTARWIRSRATQAANALAKSKPRPAQAFAPGTDGHCLIAALEARRIAYRYLPEREAGEHAACTPVIAFSMGGEDHLYGFGLYRPGPFSSNGVGAEFARDKMRVKALLKAGGVNVPDGSAFPRDDLAEGEAFFSGFVSGRPEGVCLKPGHGRGGKRVYLGVRDLAAFRAAWQRIGRRFSHVLIEEMAAGTMYRVFCVGGQAIAAISWQTMNVVGDGRHTLAELIARKNAERRLNPAYAEFPIALGRKERAFLQRSGVRSSDIPARNLIVPLRPAPNEDEATDATETLHASYYALVERALGLAPPMIYCGVDLMVEDASMPAGADNYRVLELNYPARFVDHHHPWRGRSRDVAGAILDHLQPGAAAASGANRAVTTPGA